ncbi:MAG TPA: NlpC/P60 family protein [Streptosporangiaceae bacterium]|nr:NlpC/P60 family protein [Streptosporangiaceae bacterium]
MRYARGSGGTVRYRLGGRASLHVVVVCGLLVALSPPAAQARPRLEGHPKPPSQAQINAAENRVRQHQAALGAAQGKLSAASVELARLQTQAEVLIERYDQAQVNEQRAASAYQVTEARLRQAERQQAASRLRVARLAARQFESGGGFSPVTVMLGDADGPQAYLRQVGMGQALAESGTETLAANQANNAVATVFRAQAHKLLVARQAALQAANDLKVAIQAAVSRQQTFVKLTTGKRNKLAGELASAQSKASSLKAARQAALAAAAAERAAAAAAAAGPSGSSQVPSWAWGSGASADQGDIAANWALSQLGKPYQWGGAGPARYDCSGLTMVAWAHAGVQLLHYTGYQWQEGPHVPLSQLRRGDLLFYATNTSDPSTIHHVAIYIGHGMMVNAPYTGAFVRIDGMYAPGGLIGAVRPAG